MSVILYSHSLCLPPGPSRHASCIIREINVSIQASYKNRKWQTQGHSPKSNLNQLATAMKVLSVALCFFLTSGFVQNAVGLHCDSGCAACWKLGPPGVDIKLGCDDNGHCGEACPAGYTFLHCAKPQRCYCRTGKNCSELGPCLCGTEVDGDWTQCKVPKAGATC